MGAKSVTRCRLDRPVRLCFHELSCVPLAKAFLPDVLMQSRPSFPGMRSEPLVPTHRPDPLHGGFDSLEPVDSEDLESRDHGWLLCSICERGRSITDGASAGASRAGNLQDELAALCKFRRSQLDRLGLVGEPGIDGRQHQRGQHRGGEEAADDHGGQRSLDLGAGRGG